MNKSHSDYKKVIEKIKQLQAKKTFPVVVSIDGGSGSGKTTLAALIVEELDAVVIPTDDFFSGNIPEDNWGKFTIEEKLDKVLDWQRLRNSVIKPLLNSEPIRWQALDFELGIQPNGTYKLKSDYSVRKPAKVILLEGAYSFSPKLSDLVDMSVLMDVDIEKRHSRLSAREPKEFLEKWPCTWDAVEKYYYSEIRPKSSYDLVVKFD